jgi:hypothetical protein
MMLSFAVVNSTLYMSSLTSSSTLSYAITETSSFSLVDSFSLPQTMINMLSLSRYISHHASFPLIFTSSWAHTFAKTGAHMPLKPVSRTASSISTRFNSQATSFPLMVTTISLHFNTYSGSKSWLLTMSKSYTSSNSTSFPLVISGTVTPFYTSLRSTSYLQVTAKSRASSSSLTFVQTPLHA